MDSSQIPVANNMHIDFVEIIVRVPILIPLPQSPAFPPSSRSPANSP